MLHLHGAQGLPRPALGLQLLHHLLREEDPVWADVLRRDLRHLALENAVVLPIARLRLSAEDLLALSRRLAARRGLVLDAPP